MKVLILEDEWLIGEGLKDELEALGCSVIGPVSTCAAALEAIWQSPPDLAILDTHLIGETCETVVEECERSGIPLVIASGMMEGDLPVFAKGRAYLGKPYSPSDIALHIERPAKG